MCVRCSRKRNVRAERVHYEKGFCSARCLELFQTKKKGPTFYESDDWRRLRYFVLKRDGRVCRACGATNGMLHVDHIKPRSKYPELELDPNNLQVLCGPCNKGKGAWDETDFRNIDSGS